MAWETVCLPRKKGGLGVKNLDLWNAACIAKLVWAISMKKDILWVRWVYGRYIKGRDWWGYTPKGDSSWYWEKLNRIKDKFRDYPKAIYKVKEGYIWLQTNQTCHPRFRDSWTRLSLLRHNFIAWLLRHQKLPVLQSIGRFSPQLSIECRWCQ